MWFSCGCPSAVTVKLAIAAYAKTHEVVVARIKIPSEHPDNDRFARECAEWFGQPIVTLASARYDDVWDVWEQRRFLVSNEGALCTTEMKKMVRFAFQRCDDLQLFGYAADKLDVERSVRFREQNFEIDCDFPLIDAGLSKADCKALVERAGIEIPMMYKLGYANNNCIGCVKGGLGYWNKIRRDFPATFARQATLQRSIDAKTLKYRGELIFLDELPPEAGRYQDEPDISCSVACEVVSRSMASA